MTDALHRIHAEPSAKGNRLDIGAVAWRGEGGAFDEKHAQARRLAVCWNVLEGWPADALEAGALRDVDAAARAVLEAADGSRLSPELAAAVTKLREAFGRRDAQQDLTNGRLHDCESCLAKEVDGD